MGMSNISQIKNPKVYTAINIYYTIIIKKYFDQTRFVHNTIPFLFVRLVQNVTDFVLFPPHGTNKRPHQNNGDFATWNC